MPVKAQRMQLCEILVKKGIITPAQVEQALKSQKDNGGLIGENLINLGLASERDIAEALAEQYKMPYISISSYNVDSQLVAIIPPDMARRYQLIPLEKVANILTVAISDPLDVSMLEDVEKITQCKVQVVVSTKSDINRAILKYYQRPKILDKDEKISSLLAKPAQPKPQQPKPEEPRPQDVSLDTLLSNQQKVIQDLEKQLAAQTDDLLKVTKINSQLEHEILQQRQLIEGAFKEKESAAAELIDLKNKLKESEQQLKNKEEQLAQSTQSYITLKKELDRIESNLELSATERRQLRDSIDSVNIIYKDLKSQKTGKLNVGDIVAIVLSLIVLAVLILLMVI